MSSKTKAIHHCIFPVSLALLILGIELVSGSSVLAQTTTTPVTISSIDVSQFPSVTLDVQFSKELDSTFSSVLPAQIQISEDGQIITPNTVNKIEPGLQTILALNAGSYMAIDYRQQTLYQHVQNQVLSWLEHQSNTQKDDYSFISNSSTVLSHVADPQILDQSLAGFKPNLLASIPSLQALSSALTIASEPLPRETMQRAIFYFTVMPDKAALQAMPSLTTQATSLGVKVFVWLIAPLDMATSQNTLPLVQLAENTGGDFFLYSGPETIPDLETELNPLRSFLQVQYSSLIRTSGTDEVSVKILDSANAWGSEVHPFQINLLSPNIFFLSPETSVHRVWERSSPSTENRLTPASLTFQIKVEFPDDHVRSLVKTEFKVDGEIIQTLTKEPFDAFTWNISPIEASGEHLLQVQGEDVLGFQFQTLEIPVEIMVDPPPLSLFSRILGFMTSGPMLATLIGVITSGAILAIVFRTNQIRKNKKRQSVPQFTDPLTQQVDLPKVSKHKNGGSSQPSPVQTPKEKPYARLVKLSQITQDAIPDAVLYISKRDVTLGSDPRVVSIGIPSPSVSPIHARIQLTDSGTFLINDMKSTAGTWVNFAPVSSKGAALESGDLVHIGKLLYRFEVLNRPLWLTKKANPSLP